MPHILLVTTADLAENGNIPDILEALVEKLCTFDTIASPSVKAYHAMRANWAMGEGAAPGFAHVEVAILAGRPADLKQRIADGMWAALQTAFAESVERGDVQLTLEVREMEAATYRK